MKKVNIASSFSPDLVVQTLQLALNKDVEGFTTSRPAMAVFKQALLSGFSKKYLKEDYDDVLLTNNAYKRFLESNSIMLTENLSAHLTDNWPLEAVGTDWRRDMRRFASEDPFSRNRVLQRAKQLIDAVLGSFSQAQLNEFVRNSTGVTVGTSFCNSSSVDKLKMPMTVTSSCVGLFKQLVLDEPDIKQVISDLNQDYYQDYNRKVLIADSICNGEQPVFEVLKVVRGSKTATVPKNNETHRITQSEPTINMLFELGIMEMIVMRLRAFGLDLSTLQDRHRSWAQKASLDGKKGTIDLVDASSRISTALVKYLLPEDWFNVMDCIRCDETFLPSKSGEGEWVELHMWSTMGNGYTFPIETLIFWAIACSVHQELTPGDRFRSIVTQNSMKECSVFGDDVIMPTGSCQRFVDVISSLGMSANADKSFISDPGFIPLCFRESCGGDFYHGVDVRPFFVRKPTGTAVSSQLEPWLYIIWNSMLRKYISYFGRANFSYIINSSFFRELAVLFMQYGLKVKLVPAYFPDDSGIQVQDDVIFSMRCFDLITNFSPIKVNAHGRFEFSYCNFRYVDKEIDALYRAHNLWIADNSDASKQVSFAAGLLVNQSHNYYFASSSLIRRDYFSCLMDVLNHDSHLSSSAFAKSAFKFSSFTDLFVASETSLVTLSKKVGNYVVATAYSSSLGIGIMNYQTNKTLSYLLDGLEASRRIRNDPPEYQLALKNGYFNPKKGNKTRSRAGSLSRKAAIMMYFNLHS